MVRLLFLSFIISQASFAQLNSGKSSLIIDSTVNLFVFVGQKISVNQFDANANYNQPISSEVDSATGETIVRKRSYIMDNAFEAKYKVIQSVFNDLRTDTIVFKAYDHYGRPGFENYSTVLLYISKSEDGSHYFHQKYQFDPLYKIKNNYWVGKNGESLQKLFNLRKEAVFKGRGLFK